MDIEIKTVVNNLKVIVGEFNIKAKDYNSVVAPIQILLDNLVSGKWRVVEDAPIKNSAPVVPTEKN